MADQNLDAKTGENPGEVSSTSQIDPEHFNPDSENLIPTVEDDIGGIDVTTGGKGEVEKEKVEDAGKGKEKAETTKEESVKDEKATKDDDVPEEFHKHPAWQRIMLERDKARLKAEDLSKKIESLETTTKGTGKEPEFIDIDKLTTEELLEWQNDDPKGFAKNFLSVVKKNVRESIIAELEEKNQTAKIDKTYDSYASKNPDNKGGTGFVQMWENGQIKSFMDNNPGHNAISAHMALTFEERLNAAKNEASQKVKEEMTKQQRARVITDGLGSAPGYTPSREDTELKDTKKKGVLLLSFQIGLPRGGNSNHKGGP